MIIKVGKSSFSAESLTGITLSEAKAKFKHIPDRVVEEAYKIANPNGSRKKSRKK